MALETFVVNANAKIIDKPNINIDKITSRVRNSINSSFFSKIKNIMIE